MWPVQSVVPSMLLLLLLLPITGAERGADDCVAEPWKRACANYIYPHGAHDLELLCGRNGMPHTVGCELYLACGHDVSGFCQPLSLLADICVLDGMVEMVGCSAYRSMCVPRNSTVRECTHAAPVPDFVSTKAARDAVAQMCSSMPAMSGCHTCTAHNCTAPLHSLSQVCHSMPSMHMCSPIESMCDKLASSGKTLADAFCSGLPDSSHTSSSGDAQFCMDGTSMYMNGFVWGFDGDTCVVLLSSAMTLNTRVKYVFGLLGVVFIGILYEGLGYARRSTAAGTWPSCWTGTKPASVSQRQWVDSGFHVVQIALGYALMLVAMTYHIPLFLCVLVGIGIGHGSFAHRNVARTSNDVHVRAQVEPCCPESTPILQINQ